MQVDPAKDYDIGGCFVVVDNVEEGIINGTLHLKEKKTEKIKIAVSMVGYIGVCRWIAD